MVSAVNQSVKNSFGASHCLAPWLINFENGSHAISIVSVPCKVAKKALDSQNVSLDMDIVLARIEIRKNCITEVFANVLILIFSGVEGGPGRCESLVAKKQHMD